MEKINVDAINKTSISAARDYCFAVKPLWLIATNSENTYTLNCRNHNHAFYELHIITSGRLIYSFGTEELTLCESQFTVIPPHHRHKVQSHSDNIEKFTLAFEIDTDSPVLSAMNNIANKCFCLSKSAELYFREILALCSSKKDYKAEMIYLSLCNLLFEIAELSDNSSKTKNHQSDSDDRVFKAKKYIEDNFDVFFTCEEVALYCRIGEKQLGRLFKKYENMSLLEFIHLKKFESIKKLMRESNMSHRKIAENLGFSSAQYFGKFVLRMSGMTPEELRRSISNN